MGLKEYILRRGVETLVAFFVLITLGFYMFRVMPGDPTAFLLLNPNISPETRALLKQRLGLDSPLHIQYFYYIKNFIMGEFGYSFQYGRPVLGLIFSYRLINTLILVGSSTILAILIGLFLGIIAASRRTSFLDVSLLVFSLAFNSMPSFWLGMLLLLVLGVYMGLFPLGGTLSLNVGGNIVSLIADYLWHITLPVTVLTLIQIGYNFLIARTVLIDVLTESYIVTARAKGVPERLVLLRHALRNAMLPLITVIALQLAGIFTGAVITETVFSWDGLGTLLYEAVDTRDYPLLQGLYAVITIVFLVANYVTDVLYAFIDPRVRYGGE